MRARAQKTRPGRMMIAGRATITNRAKMHFTMRVSALLNALSALAVENVAANVQSA